MRVVGVGRVAERVTRACAAANTPLAPDIQLHMGLHNQVCVGCVGVWVLRQTWMSWGQPCLPPWRCVCPCAARAAIRGVCLGQVANHMTAGALPEYMPVPVSCTLPQYMVNVCLQLRLVATGHQAAAGCGVSPPLLHLRPA
jgi:hypothetical protein